MFIPEREVRYLAMGEASRLKVWVSNWHQASIAAFQSRLCLGFVEGVGEILHHGYGHKHFCFSGLTYCSLNQVKIAEEHETLSNRVRRMDKRWTWLWFLCNCILLWTIKQQTVKRKIRFKSHISNNANHILFSNFQLQMWPYYLTQFSPCASTGGHTECKPHLHVNLKIYQVLSIM